VTLRDDPGGRPEPLRRGNPRLKRLRRLASSRRERDEAGLLLLEGPTLVGEALDRDLAIEELLHEEQRFDDLAARAAAAGVPTHAVAEGVLGPLLTTTTPQPVVALVRQPRAELHAVVPDAAAQRRPLLVLAEVGDPGNAGALLRTAEAAGVAGVVFTDGTVDAFAPKVVRASAGAVLRVPVVVGVALDEVLGALRGADLAAVGTVRAGGRPPEAVDLSGGFALVLGNEAHGLAPDVAAVLDTVMTVPMEGTVESLNVGVAGAVALFEASRQRRQGANRPGAAALVSRASHELRSPLTAVKGFSGVLVNRWDRLDDDKKRSMLVDVNREAERLARMIGELLDMSRVETGRLALQQRPIELAALMGGAIDDVRAEFADLEVAVELPDDAPPVVGDPDRLRRLVANLLENAAKYGGGEDVRVTVDTSGVAAAGVVALTVRDGGPGLTAEEVERIFEPLAGPAGGRPSGTGFGLWLARAIAEAHGGDLVVAATPGAGTAVTLTLPVEAVA
jgi:TrmH family RNA methyltransferase